MGSIAWAKEDGIRSDGKAFYPNCIICGEEVRTTVYSRKMTYICEDCKKIIRELKRERQEKKGDDLRTKGEKRFDAAVKKLKKQGMDSTWNKAIEVAKTRIDKYETVPEVIMAIGLLYTKHKIIPQQKVGNLRADFVIPSMKRAVEVDGEIYHLKYSKEEERDLRMCAMLGKGWDVVHVPTAMVEENVLHAISFFVDKKKPTVLR